jgi:hypothetical protein
VQADDADTGVLPRRQAWSVKPGLDARPHDQLPSRREGTTGLRPDCNQSEKKHSSYGTNADVSQLLHGSCFLSRDAIL